MLVNRNWYRRLIAVSCAAMFVALLCAGVGCDPSSYTNAPEGTTTSLYGVFSAPNGSPGTIDVSGTSYPATATLALGTGPNTIPLSGQVTTGGQEINVTGYYDPDSGAIAFGDDVTYNFAGQVIAGRCTGIAYVPGGPGSFVLFLNGTSTSSTTYCGSASCDTPDGCIAYGSFNLVVNGSYALMTGSYNGATGAGAGTATASSVHIDVVDVNSGVDVDIDGDITGSTISGRWVDNENGYAGPWSGDTAS